ncbi:MAG: hypothetical protein Q8P46_10970 [Hyphomicrobiales bacterium]|nr:hypothetical protein [Hyphomicrobiales bacterium]
MSLSLFPLLNIAKNTIRRKNLVTVFNKSISHLTERQTAAQKQEILDWYDRESISLEDLATGLSQALWSEAKGFGDTLAANASGALRRAHTSFGGGGVHRLLFFLTRLRHPMTVVETGVAAGWSSAAFLEALERNGDGGRLFSSDFPYLRQKNPTADIGLLVPKPLRANWRLESV